MKHDLTLLGGVAALILVAGAYIHGGGAVRIENHLGGGVRAALGDEGFEWAAVRMDGVDVLLDGEAPSAGNLERAIVLAEAVPGVRRVTAGVEPAPPEPADPGGSEPPIAPPTSPPDVESPPVEEAPSSAPTDPVVTTPEPSRSPPERSRRASRVRPARDVTSCMDRFDRALRDAPIRFDSGAAGLSDGARTLLDEVASVARRCREPGIEVVGHADSAEPDPRRLSEARAREVLDYLYTRGVAVDRMFSVGRGARAQDAGAETRNDGPPDNRRVEITIRED